MNNQLSLSELLSELNSNKRKTRKKAERAIVAMGEDVVDTILKFAHEINQRLLSGYQPESVLHSLRLHIRILGMIKSSRAIQMVSAAVADSAELIYAQRQTIRHMKSAIIPDATSILSAGDRLSVAKRLHQTAIKALVRIGDEAERQVSSHMNDFSPIAQKSIRRVLRTIRFRRFCRRLVGR